MQVKLTDQTYGVVRPELHGQFIEFLGQCIDQGIWVGKESDISNVDGFRLDVVEALKALSPAVVRWPGGCYADTYHWRDGIGDPDKRPTTFNENFGTYELDHHQFGTDEFMQFCELINARPWLNINLLSGSVSEMQEWMSYCNQDEKTTLAKLRDANGHSEPYHVKYWGIGNEAWAGGGFMTPEMYSQKYREYASAMPTFKKSIFDDNKIYKIASGPDGNKPLERVNWTRDLLASLAKYRQPEIDALDLHFYNWNLDNPKDTPTHFNAKDWDRVINGAYELETVIQEQSRVIADGLARMPKPESEMDQRLEHLDLVVGEWGNWHKTAFTAQPALKQQVTMRDAVTTAITLNILQRHCNQVSMACVAQTVNVLNALILTEDEETILTPNYDVFMMYRDFENGEALTLTVDDENPNLDVFATKNGDEINLSVVNKNNATEQALQLGFDHPVKMTKHQQLVSDDNQAFNSAQQPDRIRRQQVAVTETSAKQVTLMVPSASVSVFKFSTQA